MQFNCDLKVEIFPCFLVPCYFPMVTQFIGGKKLSNLHRAGQKKLDVA